MKAEKAPTDTEKTTLDTQGAKHDAEEAKNSAEEAKVKLLKTKNYSEDAMAKFKLKADQPKAILNIIKKTAKNSKITRFFLSNLANYQVSKNKQLETEP